jgi:hypothetical protein
MHSRLHVRRGRAAASGRVSQVPCRSFDTRRPLRPRETPRPSAQADSTSLVADAGFTNSDRLAVSTWWNEAVPGSLSLRLASSPPEAPTVQSLAPPLGWLHVSWSFHMAGSFHPARVAWLILTHQRSRRTHCYRSSSRTSRPLRGLRVPRIWLRPCRAVPP